MSKNLKVQAQGETLEEVSQMRDYREFVRTYRCPENSYRPCHHIAVDEDGLVMGAEKYWEMEEENPEELAVLTAETGRLPLSFYLEVIKEV